MRKTSIPNNTIQELRKISLRQTVNNGLYRTKFTSWNSFMKKHFDSFDKWILMNRMNINN